MRGGGKCVKLPAEGECRTRESSFQFTFGLLRFCFTSPCDWILKLTSSFQPIRFKTKTNRDLVTHVSRALNCLFVFFFASALAFYINLLCLHWLFEILWFWFYSTQLNCSFSCMHAFDRQNIDRRKYLLKFFKVLMSILIAHNLLH